MSRRIHLGVVRDFRAEGWPSMDLCADQLLAHLPAAAPVVEPIDLQPPFRHIAARLPLPRGAAFNADRLINRQVLLPRVVRRAAGLDFVHVVDHSYAHLALAVPPGRAGVYCHDLDAFRCLLEPDREPRPWWFRRMTRRILAGLRRAAVVFHNTTAVRDRILEFDLLPADRLVHAPLGVAAEFTPDATPARLPTGVTEPYLLHVGSNIPRKRLDVLLDVFAEVRPRVPRLRLVQVGGPWPAALADRIDRLGIGPAVVQVRGLARSELAELYRRAAAVLVPSEAEGFGLPVIEALACGAPVIASDLPALREAGGAAGLYCPVADVPAWTAAVIGVLTDPDHAPPRAARLAQATRFSWREHARIIGETYLRLSCASSS